MAGKKAGNYFAYTAAFGGELDPYGAAIKLAALVVHIPHIHQFFQIIADITALIIATGLQLTCGQLIFTHIELKQRLHCIYFQGAHLLKLILNHIEQQTV